MKNFMQTLVKETLSDPKIKEKIHKKMTKLERELKWLASIYFDKEITIIYGTNVKVENGKENGYAKRSDEDKTSDLL